MPLHNDIYPIIFEFAPDAFSFRNISLTCRQFNTICMALQGKMKKKFSKLVKTELEEYYVLPNGKIHGEYKNWYEHGKLWEHAFYENGERNGEFKIMYSDGQLFKHSSYKNGKSNGECKQWHFNGQLSEHVFYENDKLNGEYKEWFPNGKLWKHAFYKDGKEIEAKK
jgi:antitoxin component YwqK of YwqJK toxin-antitoxin module